MASALAQQLAGIRSVDADRLQAATAKSRASFLFPSRQAAALSNSDIHSLGYNGFLALVQDDSRFEKFGRPIFGEQAKGTDRSLLTKDENVKLDGLLAEFLRLLSGRFLLKSAGKVLEWLIRRFRINEFNIDDLMAAILPYHETPQFAQMLQIMQIETGRFTALQAVKKSLQSMPRDHLLTAMHKSRDLARFVATMLAPYAKQAVLYSTLVAFWTGTMAGYLDKQQAVDETSMSVLLPVLVEGATNSNGDLQLGSLIVLSRLTGKVDLSQQAIDLLIAAILSARNIKTANADKLEALLTTVVVMCQSQRDTIPTMPKKVVTAILSHPQALDVLSRISASYTAEKFLQPFLTALAGAAITDEVAATALYGLMAPTTVPDQITALGLPVLIRKSLQSSDAPPPLLKVLNALYQRASVPYYDVCKSLKSEENEHKAAHINRLMASVSGYGLFTSAKPSDADISLSLESADPQARAKALERVLDAAVTEDCDGPLPPALRSTMMQRLADPAIPVADALFSKNGKVLLSRLAGHEPEALLQASLQTISDASTARHTTILHLEFLLSEFFQAVPAKRQSALRFSFLTKALWPKLLAAKANYKMWKAVWQLLQACEQDWPLLQGCADGVDLENKEAAPAFNITLASRTAKNMSDAQRFAEIRTFIFESGVGATPSSSSGLLSSLVLHHLVLAGDAEALDRVLKTSVEDVKSASFPTSRDAASTVSLDVRTAIYAKPSSANTRRKLASELYHTALVSLQPISEAKWCWLAAESALPLATRSLRQHATRAYVIAHDAKLPTSFRTSVLAHLYNKVLSEDVLAFLAKIYCTPSLPQAVRVAALRDVAMYLDSVNKASGSNGSNDFQTLLPSMLVAILSPDKEVRQGALNLIEKILARSEAAGSDQRIYGFDAFYGATSNTLQYITIQQLTQYCRILQASTAELSIDGDYATHLHAAKLLDAAAVSKKKSLSHAIFCYLASHVNAWSDINAQSSLLAVTQNMRDGTRARAFLPLMLSVAQGDLVSAVANEDTKIGNYAGLVIEAYRSNSKSGYQDEEFSAFLSVLDNKRSDTLGVAFRRRARHAASHRIFASCSLSQKLLLLERLLKGLRTVPSAEILDHRTAIQALSLDSITMATFIDKTRQALSLDGEQTAKKSRGPAESSAQQDKLANFALALESINTDNLEASVALLAISIETLGSLVELQASQQADVSYCSQLLTALATNVAARITVTGKDAIEGIRVSPVLEVIRISQNPQSANLALTLVANLVDIVPEQVIQNVLPIFTFMGTNVLQRDDAASCRVVDKTIESIVPALVKHRKQSSVNRDQVIAGLSDFLQVFADAANHVPRHRRNRLFIRFVEVLGPKDFLAPVSGLLVDKVAMRLIKTQDSSLLALPLALMAKFPADTQAEASCQFLEDLLGKIKALNLESADLSVVSRQSTPNTATESPALPVNTSRRTVLASLHFIGLALSEPSLHKKVIQARSLGSIDIDVKIQDLIKMGLLFYDVPSQKLSALDLSHMQKTMDTVIEAASKLIRASQMAEVMEWALRKGSDKVAQLALRLLLDRLRFIKAPKRPDLQSAISAAFERLTARLSSSTGKAEKLATYDSLETLAKYSGQDDVPLLAKVLPAVLDEYGRETQLAIVTKQADFISNAIPSLGPRIIPHVSRIMSMMLHTIQEQTSSFAESSARVLTRSALNVVQAIFNTAPTFAQPHLQKVLEVLFSTTVVQAREDKPTEDAVSVTLRAIGKNVPTRIIIAAAGKLWQDAQKSDAKCLICITSLLSNALKHTKTEEVLDIYKPTFAIMLQIFDLRQSSIMPEEAMSAVEASACASFAHLILKLNEGTFRPLFLRLFDWAVIDSASDPHVLSSRKTVLFRVIDRMLSNLKAIALPYYSFMLDQVADTLISTESVSPALWNLVIESLQRALAIEDTGFWNSTRLGKLVEGFAAQAVAVSPAQKPAYHQALEGYAQAIEAHEAVTHDLVRALLKRTRTDNEEHQLAAVQALLQLWNSGIEASLAAYSAECMPFLAETLETGGVVARTTKELLARMNEESAALSDSSDDERADSDGDLSEA